jgi:hypothetical protein
MSNSCLPPITHYHVHKRLCGFYIETEAPDYDIEGILFVMLPPKRTCQGILTIHSSGRML